MSYIERQRWERKRDRNKIVNILSFQFSNQTNFIQHQSWSNLIIRLILRYQYYFITFLLFKLYYTGSVFQNIPQIIGNNMINCKFSVQSIWNCKFFSCCLWFAEYLEKIFSSIKLFESMFYRLYKNRAGSGISTWFSNFLR